MPKLEDNNFRIIAENLTCRHCGGTEWICEELTAKAQVAGALEMHEKRFANVNTVHFKNRGKMMVGDVWTIIYILEDVCKTCLNQQVVRVEGEETQAVMRSGLVTPNTLKN